jgi:hypothetical protein
MRYVLHVTTKNTFSVQEKLFALGYTWNGKNRRQYKNWSALVIDDATFNISKDSLKHTCHLLSIDVSKLLTFSDLRTTSGSPIRTKPNKLAAIESAVKSIQQKQQNAVQAVEQETIVIGSKCIYQDKAQKAVAEVLGISGKMAWIKTSITLSNGKTSDVVLLDDLELITDEKAIEAEVYQIMKNSTNISLAAKHVIAYLTKKLKPQDNELTQTELVCSAPLTIFGNKAHQLIKKSFKSGESISRIDLVRGLRLSKAAASRILVELERAGVVRVSVPGSSRANYRVI